jgi:hypothetical protein
MKFRLFTTDRLAVGIWKEYLSDQTTGLNIR